MEIQVQGRHHTDVPGELGSLTLSVIAENPDKATAYHSARGASGRVSNHLASLAAATPSPLARYSVGAVQVTSWRPPAEPGRLLAPVFRASTAITATFHDVPALSQFAAAAGREAFVHLGAITWSLTDETGTSCEEDALRAAVADAVRRASVIAAAAGQGGVEVLEVADPGLLAGARERGEGLMMARAFGGEESAALDSDFLDVVPETVRVDVCVEIRARTT